MKFSRAITRKPAPSLAKGITEANLGTPDYKTAQKQHHLYIEALRKLGLKVEVLPEDAAFPDSVFVEDTAVCTPKFALISRPGASSRRKEIDSIQPVLEQYFDEIRKITAPGTLDGGDVMMVEDHYYIGLSNRTNAEGAEQFIGFLEHFGYLGSVVEMEHMLHLKTGLSYLEHNNLLVFGEFAERDEFKPFNRILIPDEESYAANSLWINDTVLVPDHHPKAKQLIEEAGYKTISLPVSEFQKLDGGLSCLSLRF